MNKEGLESLLLDINKEICPYLLVIIVRGISK